MRTIWMAALVLATAGCGGDKAGNAAANVDGADQNAAGNAAGERSADERAVAELRTAAGEARGTAQLTPDGDGLRVAVAAEGMTVGAYGVHLHQAGRCEGPAFESAGSHWNPTGRQHGRDNPAGAHLGDLPNLEIGGDGRGTLSFRVPGASLNGANALLDADGATLLIHARPDDYRTDPSGDSGDRIACGVFRAG